MKKTMLVCLVMAMMLSGCSSTTNKNIDNSTQTTQNTEQQSNVKYIMAGKIDANDQANISSKISARVSGVLVDIGSSVNAGDPVIKLDTRDLEAQVEQNEAALKNAQAKLNDAMNPRPEQIAQDQASLDSANKSYEVTKNDYDRTKTLFDAGAATKQQVETAEKQLAAAQQQVTSAQETLEMHKEGSSEANIQACKASVEQSEAALKSAQVNLSNGTILAPISGVINAKSINVGEMVSPGVTLLSISNPNALIVNAYVPIDIAGQFKEGQEVIVKVAEVDNTEFQGKISVINSKLNAQSRNVLIKVALSDPNSVLKPGMFAEVGIKE